jgi:HlyD family secretion protein
MANTTQPEVSDKPKQPEVSDKSKPADASGKYSIKKVGKILLYVLLVVAALFLVKYFFFTPPEVVVVQVRQQDYAGEVQGTGTINVDVLAAVGAKIPGRIERVLVNEGDFVRSGQVIATLEDTDIRQVVERSQARLEAARMTEQASRATEQSRRATEYQAERAWEREKHLVATGAVSQEEADQYEERYRAAASAVGAAEADVGAAQAQVEATEAEVRLQQFNLSQTKIFTYVNGVVTDRPKRSGDAIVSGESVLTVADPKVTLVEAYLDQRFAGQIRAGQTATVILRGRAKEQIPGRVYRIRPQADPAAEEMTVEISFPLPPAELQIGQWADVYVQVSQTKNALVVPKTAVMLMGDERFVLVADAGNRARQVKIESLASSPRSQVMAVAGDLKPGDWVLRQPVGIQPGQKVHTTQSNGAADAGPKANMPAMKM